MNAGTCAGVVGAVAWLLAPGSPAYGQEPATTVPATRAEAIAEARDDKLAELWPERQSPLVNKVNALVDAAYQIVRHVCLGSTVGYLRASTARGHGDFPPIDEAFTPEEIPGFGESTDYTRIGAFGYFERRASSSSAITRTRFTTSDIQSRIGKWAKNPTSRCRSLKTD